MRTIRIQNKILRRVLAVIVFAALFLSSPAQTTTYGDTIFFESFGQHATRVPSPYMPSGSYTFADGNGDRNQREIQDNYYAVIAPLHIVDAIPSGYSYFWSSISPFSTTPPGAAPYYTTDHTGDFNGAVMAVNAGITVNYIYKRNLTLKTGYRYLFSFWIYLVRATSQFSMEAQNLTTGKTYTPNGAVLSQKDEGKWIKYDLNFSVPISNNNKTNEVVVGLQNLYKLIQGNDYYIDDILVSTLYTDPLTIDTVYNTGPVCEGSNVTLSVGSKGDAKPFSYSWKGPNGFTSTDAYPVITNCTTEMSGTYYITITDALGQTATDSTVVKVHPTPTCDFSLSSATIDSKHNTITGSISPQPNIQYTWDMGDGTIKTGSVIEHTYDVSSSVYEYTITLTAVSELGCTSSCNKSLDVVLYVPNIFTPNGDGINDTFMPNYELTIYDRQGNTLYEGSDGWDGNYKGQKADNDTYFYLIKYTDKNKQVQSKKGYVMLKR